ncbi:MAG TPA: peptidoglycan DD-metalloendopeptidase family protein [Methyloceanibacter sp.]|nr:peptidoglycan DD-metalloendopeptidase family protein [Methyloceanibacter sp.]
MRHGRNGRRKTGQALIVAEPAGLPAIYLGEQPKEIRKLPGIYLCETGCDGISGRLKWLAGTCVAGAVGVCMIGVAIYASMNMSDGDGMVSSIRRASLAALQPMRGATLAHDKQSASGEKGDRIKMTATGFATRHVIHDSVVERQGRREYITIKPYIRIVAGLATTEPEDAASLPPFNPFKLYSDATPIDAGNGDAVNAAELIAVNVLDVADGAFPEDDGIELKPEDIEGLIAEAAENFAVAETPQLTPGADEATLQQASYRPDQVMGQVVLAPNTTVIHKTEDEATEDGEDNADALPDGSETKSLVVGRGDNMSSLLAKIGAEPSEAKVIVDAFAPVFHAQDLKPGQELRFTLVPAPSDTGQMEPFKISVFAKGDVHLATVARNKNGDFAASDQSVSLTEADEISKLQGPKATTLYQSFYHAALTQHLPADTILKLLRVHSYDVDFKQKVKPGDSFEVFLDSPDGEADGEGAGEVLYTAMCVDGLTRDFFRFRTPDGQVDYYDEQGNSAKKFLMRNPVKGGRYTSGFGARRHPLLRYTRQHTGVDWAAPAGTPILAGGDGSVEMVGREGGYGNYIRLRHSNGFETAYGHLSQYASGLKPGARVKQGQVIGYVGSTGMSTGPHLHYEILVNNKFVNPMTIQVPRGLQLTGKELGEFQREKKRIEALMQLDPVTSRVADAGQAQ